MRKLAWGPSFAVVRIFALMVQNNHIATSLPVQLLWCPLAFILRNWLPLIYPLDYSIDLCLFVAQMLRHNWFSFPKIFLVKIGDGETAHFLRYVSHGYLPVLTLTKTTYYAKLHVMRYLHKKVEVNGSILHAVRCLHIFRLNVRHVLRQWTNEL